MHRAGAVRVPAHDGASVIDPRDSGLYRVRDRDHDGDLCKGPRGKGHELEREHEDGGNDCPVERVHGGPPFVTTLADESGSFLCDARSPGPRSNRVIISWIFIAFDTLLKIAELFSYEVVCTRS